MLPPLPVPVAVMLALSLLPLQPLGSVHSYLVAPLMANSSMCGIN
jgi:hypothetical protein